MAPNEEERMSHSPPPLAARPHRRLRLALALGGLATLGLALLAAPLIG